MKPLSQMSEHEKNVAVAELLGYTITPGGFISTNGMLIGNIPNYCTPSADCMQLMIDNKIDADYDSTQGSWCTAAISSASEDFDELNASINNSLSIAIVDCYLLMNGYEL